jgi:hypothetical protein
MAIAGNELSGNVVSIRAELQVAGYVIEFTIIGNHTYKIIL